MVRYNSFCHTPHPVFIVGFKKCKMEEAGRFIVSLEIKAAITRLRNRKVAVFYFE
jgi:hypothetical protein